MYVNCNLLFLYFSDVQRLTKTFGNVGNDKSRTVKKELTVVSMVIASDLPDFSPFVILRSRR